MERQKVYCEIDFYKRFVGSFPQEVIPSEEGIKKHKIWIDFYSYLYKSDISFDIDVQQYKSFAENDEYFKLLWKKSANGECSLEFLDSSFPKLNEMDKNINSEGSNYLKSVFLSCEPKEICESIENDYGLKVINIDNIFNEGEMFNVHIVTIERGNKTHTDWSFIERFKYHCNSIAIVDNYLLKEEKTIKENLFVILDKLLPDSIKIPFHISIFAKNDINNSERHILINNWIKAHKPNLNFKLTLHQLRNEFHDRSVVTNYFIIDSESGFDLFKDKKAIHQTKVIGYYPYSAANVNIESCQSYEVLIKSLKKIFNNSCSTKYLTNYWGDNENRLFN